MDALEGRNVFISDTFILSFFLNFRALLEKQYRDDWAIALKMHYNYGMLIVNRKHPQHKRIIKLINASIEHGIKVKRDEISKKAFLVVFFLFKKYAPEDMVEPITKVMNRQRIYFTLNELSSSFELLSFGLIASICVLIIELFFFFKSYLLSFLM